MDDAATGKTEVPSGELKYFNVQDLVEYGAKNKVDPTPPNPDDIMTIMYTSGTTGTPKVSIFFNKLCVTLKLKKNNEMLFFDNTKKSFNFFVTIKSP